MSSDKVSWKSHFGLGIAIKQNYDRIENLNENLDQTYKVELIRFKDCLYSGLKSKFFIVS